MQSNHLTPSEDAYILLRGVSLPSKVSSKPQKYESVAALEIAKNARHWGNPSRSVTLASGVPPMTSVGFCILHPDFSKFVSISPMDENTGYAKKENRLFVKRLSPAKAKEDLNKLLSLQKAGGSSTHSEIIYDVHDADISGIYFCLEENFYDINAESPLYEHYPEKSRARYNMIANSTRLQALFLQKEYERTHQKKLPIYLYRAQEKSSLKHCKPFEDEDVIKIWKEMVATYLNAIIKQDLLTMLTLSLEEVKINAAYGYNKSAYLSLDHYYHKDLKSRLNKKLHALLETKRKKAFKLLFRIDLSVDYAANIKKIDDDIQKEFLTYGGDTASMCQQFTLFYLDEIISGRKRPTVLKKLLRCHFKVWFEIDDKESKEIALKEIKQLFAMSNYIQHDHAAEIIQYYLEKKALDHRQIVNMHELIETLHKDQQSILMPLLNNYPHQINIQEPIDELDFKFMQIIKTSGCTNEEINHFAEQLMKKTLFTPENYIRLMAYIQIEGGLQAWKKQTSYSRYVSLLNELLKKNKMKKIALLKKSMLREILPSKISSFDSSQFSFSKVKIPDYALDNPARSLFCSSDEIPYTHLKGRMTIYSHQHPEYGALPLPLFELLIILGIRILLNNPGYFPRYLEQIADVSMPTHNIKRILACLLNDVLVYHPYLFQEHGVCESLKKLHPAFEEFIHAKKINLLPIPEYNHKKIERNMITQLGQIAVMYSWQNFLDTKYANEERATYFPVLYFNQQNEISFSSAKYYSAYIPGKHDHHIVWRSNHGLRLTLCSLFYVYPVLKFNLKHANNLIKNLIKRQMQTKEEAEKFISRLQVAMAFYVAGRKGEDAFGSSEYDEYRKQSAQHFYDFVKQHEKVHALFKDEDELNIYKDSLEFPHVDSATLNHDLLNGGENTVLEKTVKIILYGCHCVDLVRNWGPDDIEEKAVYDLMKAVEIKHYHHDEIIHDALLVFKIAAKLCLLMGDSLATDYDIKKRKCVLPKVPYCNLYDTKFPKTDIKKFMLYSTNPQACIELLNSVTPEILLNTRQQTSFANTHGMFSQPAACNEAMAKQEKASI